MTNPLPIHLIMPMGGRGSRFSEMGFMQPKPLIPLRGKPFFYWAAQSIAEFVSLKDIVFVTLKEHIEQFHIDEEIRRYYPNAVIRVLDDVLNGAVLTCLEGCNAVDDDLPIVFNDCDHIFQCKEFYQFCNDKEKCQHVDGGLLTFESSDPKFSFIRYDDNGDIIGTVEKEAVSNRAICGAYYFKNKSIFQSAAEQYLKNCRYQEYFVSGVYNELAKTGGQISHFDVDFHVPFGTPEEYRLVEGQPYFE